ncbi:MAG: pesticidal protein Cry7Aa [Candidatus Doudnabacteria bacterium]
MNLKREGVILKPSKQKHETVAVLNPAVVQTGNTLEMFYRAVQKDNYSTIGYCVLEGPLKVAERATEPILRPEYDYEKQGVEDPRIVNIEDTYYLTYTAFDGKNARIAYAESKNLKEWKKRGIISPQLTYDKAEDLFRKSSYNLKEKYFFFESYYKDKAGPDVILWEKDALLFPKKINGKFALIHRILPGMQIIFFDRFEQLMDKKYWEHYLKKLGEYVILEPKYAFESRNIGGGAPPLETDAGWLLIYHAVEDSSYGKIYHAAAALLDKQNPLKVIGRLDYPLFSPETDYEKSGNVNNIIFPTDTALFDDRLYIYYGAADQVIAAVSLNLNELLVELLRNT